METRIYKLSEIKSLYPNEWILVGDPIMDENTVDIYQGIVIYHSSDKKEVCYIGRDKTSEYQKVALIFTGNSKEKRKISSFFKKKVTL